MRKIQDLTGQKFGRWIVIEFANVNKHRSSCWLVKCACGNTKIVTRQALIKGQSKSCGCWKSESSHKRFFKDLTNRRFNRLVVQKLHETNDRGDSLWECLCDCGTIKLVFRASLISEATQSCGCLHKEIVSQTSRTHGLSDSRLHSIWTNMKQRCLNPKNTNFHKYGARGITICKRWLKFENFYEDVHLSYEQHMKEYGELNTTLDRIKNNKGYDPKNVRWATIEEQSQNTRQSAVTENYDEHKRQKSILCTYLNGCIAGRKKPFRFEEYFGIGLEAFKQYIEAQFSNGMAWNNHGKGKGKWEFDHVIPCNQFDLSKEEDRKECFYYSNLQPMWSEDNLKKSKSFIKETVK